MQQDIPGGAGQAEPVRRTSEIEEPTNLYVIHPLSAWIVPHCARLGISPNAVSLAGMGCGVAAAFAYHWYPHPWFCVLGFALMFTWHVLDGADGQLARLTNSFSELGKIIDGICDYVTFTAVYLALALTLSRYVGTWVWGLVAVSGLCHAVQSAAYELQRQQYNFWGWGRKSAALPDLHPPKETLRGQSVLQRAANVLHGLYTRVQIVATGGAAGFNRELEAILATKPECEAVLRQDYREAFAPSVRRWSILSANYRTIAIFLFAVAGMPMFYFLFEVFGFSAIMAWLLASQRRRYRLFLDHAARLS
ncbi:MAG: CDP-alcohol phosphatidyltransferase family protein [Acidocella sp.]|nr:CDP-alcohol phosphatidyltransferase family protein [Acidocella sp.]